MRTSNQRVVAVLLCVLSPVAGALDIPAPASNRSESGAKGLNIPAPVKKAGATGANADAIVPDSPASSSAQAKAEAEAREKAQAKADAKEREQQKAREAASARAKAVEDARVRAADEARAKAMTEAQARARAKADADARAKARADEVARQRVQAAEEARLRAKAAADARAKARADAEARAAAVEARRKLDAEVRNKVEAERKVRATTQATGRKEGADAHQHDGRWRMVLRCGPNSSNNRPGYSQSKVVSFTQSLLIETIRFNSSLGVVTENWRGDVRGGRLQMEVAGSRDDGATWSMRFTGAAGTGKSVSATGAMYDAKGRSRRDCTLDLNRE